MKARILSGSGLKKYIPNTLWLLSDKVLRLISGVFVSAYVARSLGPGQFGLLQYAIGFVALFDSLSKLGLNSLLVRELLRHPEEERIIMGTALGMRFWGGLLLVFAANATIVVTEEDQKARILVLIISLAYIFQAAEVYEYYFRAHVLGRLASIPYLVGLVLSSIGKIIMVWLSAPLLAFAALFTAESLVRAIFFRYLFNRKAEHPRCLRFHVQRAWSLLKDCWPLILGGMVVMVYMRIDQVMIKKMLGPSDVGQYSAAVRLCEAWYFIPLVIANSLSPAILSAREANTKLYTLRLRMLFRFMIVVSLAVAIPMAYFAEPIIQTLYGGEYSSAGNVLAIYIWAGTFVALGVANSKWLVAENLQVYSTIYAALGAVSNIVINLYAIPRYGIAGAAWATLISQFISGYLCLALHKRTRPAFVNVSAAVIPVEFVGRH